MRGNRSGATGNNGRGASNVCVAEDDGTDDATREATTECSAIDAPPWTPDDLDWRRGPLDDGHLARSTFASLPNPEPIRAIVDELLWLGCALDRPRRLRDELVRAGGWLVVRLAQPRADAAPALPLGPITSPRPWAAAAFAAIDAPQWPWLLHEASAGGSRQHLPWERWCLCADRFAAWAFGVGLSAVQERAAMARAAFGIEPSEPRWIAPSVRQVRGPLVTLARERAHRAEAIG